MLRSCAGSKTCAGELRERSPKRKRGSRVSGLTLRPEAGSLFRQSIGPAVAFSFLPNPVPATSERFRAKPADPRLLQWGAAVVPHPKMRRLGVKDPPAVIISGHVRRGPAQSLVEYYQQQGFFEESGRCSMTKAGTTLEEPQSNFRDPRRPSVPRPQRDHRGEQEARDGWC